MQCWSHGTFRLEKSHELTLLRPLAPKQKRKYNYRNYCRLGSLSWPCSNTIEPRPWSVLCSHAVKNRNLHACSHETVIWVCFCSPYTAAEADQGRGDQYRSSTKAGLDGNPRSCQPGLSLCNYPTYQIKLLNPRTKMATPVNCTTFVRLESKAWI